MSRVFSLAHLTVLGCSPPEMIRLAGAAGYDAVGIRAIPLGLPDEPKYDVAHDRELFDLTRRAMADTGVFINDIELARITAGVDIPSYEPAFAAGAELGARRVLSSIWVPDRSYYIDKFGELVDLAGKYGLTVELEFVTWASVSDLDQAVDVLKSVGRPNAGIMIDTLHAHRSHVPASALSALPREWFHMAHICDGPAEIPTDRETLIFQGRDAREYVGDGGIDIAAYVREMPQDTVLSIELPNLSNVQRYGYAEHASRCLEKAKAYLGK